MLFSYRIDVRCRTVAPGRPCHKPRDFPRPLGTPERSQDRRSSAVERWALETGRLAAPSRPRCSGGPAQEDAAYGGGPPATAALGGSDSGGIQVAGDLTKALAEPVLPLDIEGDLLGNSRWSASARRLTPRRPGVLGVFCEITLQLRNGNQPHPPRGLHRVDRRDDAPIDRLHADPKRLSRLSARIGQSPNAIGRPHGVGVRRGTRRTLLDRKSVAPLLPCLPSARHAYTVHLACVG